MSAWYVLSAMGFYPVCPGTPDYSIGSPLFSRIEIHLTNGNRFTVTAPGNSPDHIYVKTVLIDGHPHPGWSFSHHDILRGANLTLKMGTDLTMQENK
jgi:putative alpha-1,2-mannosidase